MIGLMAEHVCRFRIMTLAFPCLFLFLPEFLRRSAPGFPAPRLALRGSWRLFPGVFGILCLLAIGAAHADDGVIIRDDFSDGEVATPQFSSANTQWVIEQGSFGVDGAKLGENHRPVGGELNFGVDGRSQIRIDFGDVIESTPVTIRFTLSSASEGLANNNFEIELWDAQSGESYLGMMSGNAAFFGEAGGPQSGFHGFSSEGNIIPGTDRMCLDPDRPMVIEITFDDLTGVVITKDGEIAAKWPNYKRLTRINRLVFRSEGQVSWYLKDFEVKGMLRSN